MRLGERLVVAAFLCVVSFVYGAAGLTLLDALRLRLLGGSRRLLRAPGWFRLAVVGLAAVGSACVAYGMFVEPFWLQVTHVRIETLRLQPGTRPIRIALVSDLHSDAKLRPEGRLPAVVAGLKPDFIAFTGDAVNSPEGLLIFRDCMRRLAATAPTFAVTGNWDVSYWHGLGLFDDTGVQVLNGRALPLRADGAQVWVAGVGYGMLAEVERALGQVPPGEPIVFLYHSPDGIAGIAREGVDLCLSGHTHGGQVALPLYGALITLSDTGKRYESGLYRVGGTWLYVNRGIGMEGGLPRIRFFSRPEVTLIELAPQGSD